MSDDVPVFENMHSKFAKSANMTLTNAIFNQHVV
jgi:hypothetical protein